MSINKQSCSKNIAGFKEIIKSADVPPYVYNELCAQRSKNISYPAGLAYAQYLQIGTLEAIIDKSQTKCFDSSIEAKDRSYIKHLNEQLNKYYVNIEKAFGKLVTFMYKSDCEQDIGNFERSFKVFNNQLTCHSYFQDNNEKIHSGNIIRSQDLNKAGSTLKNNIMSIGHSGMPKTDNFNENNDEVSMLPVYQASYDQFSKDFCSNYQTYITMIEPEQSKYTQHAFAYFWNLWLISSKDKAFTSFKHNTAKYQKLFENLLNSGDLGKHIAPEGKANYINHIFRENMIKCYIEDANEGLSEMANAGRIKLKISNQNPDQYEFEIKKITIAQNNDSLDFVRNNIQEEHLKMWNYHNQYNIATVDDAKKLCAGERFKSITSDDIKDLKTFLDGDFVNPYLPFSNEILTFKEFMEYHY